MDKTFIDIAQYNHVDISNQIDNEWKRDSILAFVNEQKNYYYSVRLRNMEKSKLKKDFINPLETEAARRHNKRVINLVFGYMIFKIIQEMSISITKILICPDHRPTKEVHHYIQKISSFLSRPNLTNDVDISFINRKIYEIDKKTPAHRWAKKVLSGRKKANYIIDYKELHEMISKLL